MASPSSRNSPCTCGSGRRYKDCCGALDERSSKDETQVLGANPLAATMMAALTAQRGGDLDMAERLYRRALDLDPANFDALHMLGVVHFSSKSLLQAEVYLRKALSLCPPTGAALKNVSHNLAMLKEAQSAPDAPVVPSVVLQARRERQIVDVALNAQVIRGAEEVLLAGIEYMPGTSETPFTTTFQFPDIRAFELENAVVDPESQLPTNEESVLFPDFVDFSRHLLPELRYKEYALDVDNQLVTHRELWRDPWIGTLPATIVMTSGYWQNWAHFLTEVLPKVLFADAHEPWRRWPITISAMGLANAHELCSKLVSRDRQIIRAFGRIAPQRAGYVSSVGWVPYEYLYDAKVATPRLGQADIAFSGAALDLVRRRAHDLIGVDSNRRGNRRLYLRRSSRARQTANAAEVEAMFSKRGFLVVAPETLPVEEQIRLFSDAAVIVGQAGAAMANMIFSPPGCRLLAYTAYTRHSNFTYWPNMAAALGHRLHYLFGEQVGVPAHPAHPDCAVDVGKFDPALERLLST